MNGATLISLHSRRRCMQQTRKRKEKEERRMFELEDKRYHQRRPEFFRVACRRVVYAVNARMPSFNL